MVYLSGSSKVYLMYLTCKQLQWLFFNDYLPVEYSILYRICMDTTVSMVQRAANVFVILKGAMENVPNLLHTTLCRSKVWIGMKVLQPNSIILDTRKLWWIFPIKQNIYTTAAFLFFLSPFCFFNLFPVICLIFFILFD